MTTYLIALQSDFIGPSDQPLRLLNLEMLKEEGIPLREDRERIEGDYKKLRLRRQLLKALLENAGWRWRDLYRPKFKSELDMLYFIGVLRE